MIKKLPIVVFLICIGQTVLAQQTFFKTFIPNAYENFKGLVPASQSGYAFITNAAFYRVDGQGNQLVKKEISQGVYSELGSVIQSNDGRYWVSLHVFESQDIQKIKLLKLDDGGNILLTKDLGQVSSIEMPMLVAGTGGFFLIYKHYTTGGEGHLDIQYLLDDGTVAWQKEMGEVLYNYFMAKPATNGRAEICYVAKTGFEVRLLVVEKNANTTQTTIALQQQPGKHLITTGFCGSADGGYLFSGAEAGGINPEKAFIYKAAPDGTVAWQKNIGNYLGDMVTDVAAQPDGYLLLAYTGIISFSDDASGDISLIKTDLQGNRQWQKAFGSTKKDYPRCLLVPGDGSLLFGAQVSYPGQTVPVPSLCKTDALGNIASNMPIPLSPQADMKPFFTQHSAPVQQLVQASPAANGGFVLGANFLEEGAFSFFPYILKTDGDGTAAWHKKLLESPAGLKTCRQLKDGNYLAVSEQKSLFTNFCKAVKFTPAGDTLWTFSFGANNIKDVIGTADGGCLIVGSIDISFVNYEVILLRLDANGNELWYKTIGESARWETGRRVVETPEQGFLIVGNDQHEFSPVSEIHLLKIDRDGNKLFSKSFNGGVATNYASDVLITADNKYLIVGTVCRQPFLNKDLLLLKTDEQGNILWQKEMDIYLSDEATSILPTDNGGFFVAGTTGDPNAGKLEKFAFVKRMDGQGNEVSAKYYGRPGFQTTITSVLPDSEGGVVLLGNTQTQYGQEHIFFVKTDWATVPPPPALADSLLVYPNPMRKDGANLLVTNSYTGPIQAILYDASGKRMLDFGFTKTSARHLQKIPSAGLASGTYFLQVQMGTDKHLRKILVAR